MIALKLYWIYEFLKHLFKFIRFTSSPSDQEVSGAIPGSAVRFFSYGELLLGVHGLCVSVCQCFLLMFCSVLSSK